MVNFNDGLTTSTPASNIVKQLLLEAKTNTLLAFEHYIKHKASSVNTSQAVLKARLGTWYLEHYAYLQRITKGDTARQELEQIEIDLFSNHTQNLEIGRILYLIKYLTKVQDKLNLIKIDTHPDLRGANVEERNKAYGYH